MARSRRGPAWPWTVTGGSRRARKRRRSFRENDSTSRKDAKAQSGKKESLLCLFAPWRLCVRLDYFFSPLNVRYSTLAALRNSSKLILPLPTASSSALVAEIISFAGRAVGLLSAVLRDFACSTS